MKILTVAELISDLTRLANGDLNKKVILHTDEEGSFIITGVRAIPNGILELESIAKEKCGY